MRLYVLAALGALALTNAASTLNFLDKEGRSCKMQKAPNGTENIISSCDLALSSGQSIKANALDIGVHADLIADNKLAIDANGVDIDEAFGRINVTRSALKQLASAVDHSDKALHRMIMDLVDGHKTQSKLISDLSADHEKLVKRVNNLETDHQNDVDALARAHKLSVETLKNADKALDDADKALAQEDSKLWTAVRNVEKMEGPKGEQGQKGQQGFKGQQGYKGESGADGIHGNKGQKGQTGAKGEQGIQGIQGNKGAAAPIIKRSCLDWQTLGETKNGVYEIMPNGYTPTKVWCDFQTDGGGYDTLPVKGGRTTCRRTDSNSCPPGMNIWVPRTKAHWKSVLAQYGKYGGLMHVAGIYGVANGCGGCGLHPFHSASPQDHHWKALDGGKWWLRDGAYSEPSGDYSANCWLFIYDTTPHDVKFNDHNCHYCFKDYICSTNAKA